MMRRNDMKRTMLALGFLCLIGAGGAVAGAEDAEMIIVKYGKVSVRSQVPDAKVFVDDVYRGPAGNVIESIPVGMHAIRCSTETQTVTGVFEIVKNELLQLEARFDENKLVFFQEEREKVKKAEAEAEKKPKAAVAPPPLKPKKTAPPAEAKKEERKSPEEERRSLHLNMIKIYFDDIQAQEVRISHKINPKVVANFVEKKHHSGTYYRTKQNALLCDAGPCEQQWAASFGYTDETGKADTIGLTWKQTVFNGITPDGTSKRELLFCLNAECKHLEDVTNDDKPLAAVAERYRLTWSKSSLIIRRADIMKEIIDAGGVVDAY